MPKSPARETYRPIDERIHDIYAGLTASEQQLAEVVLRERSVLSAYTAAELAARAGVSPATAARFFQRLGYRNYSEARRAARRGSETGSPFSHLELALDTVPAPGNDPQGSQGPGGGDQDPAREAWHHHLAQDSANLARMAEQLEPALLRSAAAALRQARRIWVLGYRNSRALAHYAQMLLLNFASDVHLLPREGMSLGEDLAGFSGDDVLLVVAMRRRPHVLDQVIAIAGEQGLTTLIIADPTYDSSTRPGQILLRCPNQGAGIFDSMVAPLSVINHICARLAQGSDAPDPDAMRSNGAGPDGALRRRLAQIEDMHARVDGLSPSPLPLTLPQDDTPTAPPAEQRDKTD